MTVLLKETRTAYRHYNLFTVYSYDAMLYSLDMIHVCAVFLQWCMFISNSYTCLYACVSGASCHFRSHQVMQDNYFLCRLAILRRHCPEPAADAGVEWWTLCLDAWKQKSAHHNSAWRILNEFLAQVSLRKKHFGSFIILDSILRSFQLAGFELHMHDIVLMDLHGPWFRSATRMKIQRWAGTGIEITHLKAPGWISILCWLL